MVTYKVVPDSRHRPSFWHASRITSISACAVASLSFSRRLCAREITAPFCTRTAPMGTSPSSAANWASARASPIKSKSVKPGHHFSEISGAPGRTRTTGTRFRKPLLYPPELRARYENKNGLPGKIRTCDPLIRSQVLYPAELRAENPKGMISYTTMEVKHLAKYLFYTGGRLQST